MITFTIALLLLVAGYFVYGRIVDRIMGYNYNQPAPVAENADGVDYIPLPTWKVFMIQFLNIAGLGPIFGAIMGAKFGTASYLWIVLGTIFAGAVHDFIAGMISLGHNGESLPQIIGRYLGRNAKRVFIVITTILMILVGAVFVSGPADLLATITPDYLNAKVWFVIIMVYYVLATLLPIDKIIGRVYPVFAIALIFMALGVLVMLFVHCPDLPEMWNGFGTKYETAPIFPMMFVSIACGAISGFHATQSPLMARCMQNPRHGRPVFYGAMVTEGIVALVWAAAATAFFGERGIADADGNVYTAAKVATAISYEWLGALGGILALIGIVVAPISSGDTALRSVRLIIADYLHYDQKKIYHRLVISVPIFAATFAVLVYSLSDKDGFAIIWRYFGLTNQLLSVFTLWAITVFLVNKKRFYYITLVPAMFMTAVCTSYLLVAPECFHLMPEKPWIGASCGAAAALLALAWFVVWKNKPCRKLMS